MSAEGDETVEPGLRFHGALPRCRGIPSKGEYGSVPWEKAPPQHVSCPALLLRCAECGDWPGKACPPGGGDMDGLVLRSVVVSTSFPPQAPQLHLPIRGWLGSLESLHPSVEAVG